MRGRKLTFILIITVMIVKRGRIRFLHLSIEGAGQRLTAAANIDFGVGDRDQRMKKRTDERPALSRPLNNNRKSSEEVIAHCE